MGKTRRYVLHVLRKCYGKRSVRFRCRKDNSTGIKVNEWLEVTWLHSGYVPVSHLCAYGSKSWGPAEANCEILWKRIPILIVSCRMQHWPYWHLYTDCCLLQVLCHLLNRDIASKHVVFLCDIPGHQFIVMDLPLLFESGSMLDYLYKIIVVTWWVYEYLL